MYGKIKHVPNQQPESSYRPLRLSVTSCEDKIQKKKKPSIFRIEIPNDGDIW
jgi:hypothetical protein